MFDSSSECDCLKWLGRQDYSSVISREMTRHPFRGRSHFGRTFKIASDFVKPGLFEATGSHPDYHPFSLKMAGAAGFEPAHAEIKTQCLTAWRRPNKLLLCPVKASTFQDV